jgi:hypothetical protein
MASSVSAGLAFFFRARAAKATDDLELEATADQTDIRGLATA